MERGKQESNGNKMKKKTTDKQTYDAQKNMMNS